MQSRSERIAEIKDILFIVFAVLGGVWALYRYIYLESMDAKLDLDKKIAIQNTKVQLDIDIDEKYICVDGNYVVYGRFMIKNLGSKTIVFSWDPEQHKPISLIRYDSKTLMPIKDELVERDLHDRDGNVEAAISAESGVVGEVPFLVRVEKPGVHVLSFSLPVPVEELEDNEKKLGDDWAYYEQKVIHVSAENIGCGS